MPYLIRACVCVCVCTVLYTVRITLLAVMLAPITQASALGVRPALSITYNYPSSSGYAGGLLCRFAALLWCPAPGPRSPALHGRASIGGLILAVLCYALFLISSVKLVTRAICFKYTVRLYSPFPRLLWSCETPDHEEPQ